jgi:hypothetical protein
MVKARKERATAPETTTETAVLESTEPVTAPRGVDSVSASNDSSDPEEARKPILTPDPRGVTSIALGDSKGSPRVHLLRSYKYKQMQIRFDEQPAEDYLAMLKRTGWRDRTEEEGIWTKQIPDDARWQSIRDMETDFKAVANAIRTDKGLEPMMQELSAA